MPRYVVEECAMARDGAWNTRAIVDASTQEEAIQKAVPEAQRRPGNYYPWTVTRRDLIEAPIRARRVFAGYR